ncbi:MAG: hypothetical protein JST06_03115 [Bacteroidetes bacterium]|nr:hypothetical protein [Bacteroidota bacterium]MBS1628814.1 hypothetical protein [Bacteroidota bacterium]
MAAQVKKPQYAVLTADLVGSRKLGSAAVEQRLGEISRIIEAKLFRRKKSFELFRGDSFQILLERPEEVLHIALLWRAALKATVTNGMQWDARIAIGIGPVSHRAKTLAASGGPAFQQSGSLLDNLKFIETQRIAFHTSDDAWTEALNAECILAEHIISRWTANSGEAIFQQMLQGKTQQALAEHIGISQSSIHKRLQAAGWPAIRHWESYFRQSMSQRLNPKPKP